ncbi:HAD-IIB family hydrolase [Erythrobacter sp. R86502]|uniref:HAD-IIB family hydrolase n=1 Tax=Erythrobacter sp. R86502 TaxID=3093846 RepID=UPI0036D2CA66
MKIMSIALGGCITAHPKYGITQDTGGHISYILGEMQALADRNDVESAEIVTRLFDSPQLDAIHAQARESISSKLCITRIDSGNTRYLAKEALAADRKAFSRALIAELAQRAHLPDIIHAHFADAAEVAEELRKAFGIPFIYTAHSLGLDKLASITEADAGLHHRISEENAAIANAAAIIGSSRDECERQLMAYPDASIGKIHRVTPGTKKSSTDHRGKAQELIAPFLRRPERPLILAIARPVWKKNIAALVDAFGQDKFLRDNANLVIVAGQRQHFSESQSEQHDVFADLLNRIDAHDLYGSIAYPKCHDADDVAGLYQLAASSRGVFVNPALVEPYGLTVIEAASYGLPAVATCHGGTVDTVTELGHGELVDPKSAPAIAEAIRRLMTDSDYWNRCATNGVTGSASHTWSTYAEHFVKITRQVVFPVGSSTAVTPVARPPRYLLACDLDNTLTGCAEGVIAFKQMLQHRPELTFAIATGRSLVEARRIMRQWDLPDPAVWITEVGTRIFWPTPGGPSHDTMFPHNVSKDWQAADIYDAAAPIDGLTLQPQHDQNPFKCSWFYKEAVDVVTLRQSLGARRISARVIGSHGHLLDVLPRQAGKGAAILYVAAKLGIARHRIIAAGDSGNDIDMLQAASHPILVANRSPEMAGWLSTHSVHAAKGSHANGVVEGTRAYLASEGARSTAGAIHPASVCQTAGIAA